MQTSPKIAITNYDLDHIVITHNSVITSGKTPIVYNSVIRRICTFPPSSHHKVADDDGGEEEGDADVGGDEHAVPHGLDPLAAQHAEDDHEAVHEVDEAPPRHDAKVELFDVVCNENRSIWVRVLRHFPRASPIIPV